VVTIQESLRTVCGFVCAVTLAFCSAAAQAQSQGQDRVETGKYKLHKFEQAIGEETYSITRDCSPIAGQEFH
jgi:hypothetical protein